MATTTQANRRSVDTMPFAGFEWMLALRYLRARRREGFISVIAGFSFLGIMLGVATLIIVMAVMNGFQAKLFDKILGVNGHVAAFQQGVGRRIEDYDRLTTALENVDGVKSVTPFTEAQVMVSTKAQAIGGLVRGMTEQGLRNTPLVADNVLQGSIEGFEGQKGVAIGTRMAEALQLQLGGFVTLISPRGTTTPFGTAPRSRSYRVVAIFEMGMSEYDRTMVYMPLPEAQRKISRAGQVDALEIKVSNPYAVEANLPGMQAATGGELTFQTWKQRNQTFRAVLEVERTVMFIILSLIILVAALNIVSGMMMLVKDKSRDIAILRTMGATRGAMMRVFLITGASIGIVGTIAGFILGMIFLWQIEAIRQFVQWVTGQTVFDPSVYYLSQLPVAVDPVETAVIVVMGLLLSVFATFYPSWRAATLDPVEALRYE